MTVRGQILLVALLSSGSISATPLVVPADKIFSNLAVFDELDVVLLSPDSVFANASPLDLTGPGTDPWVSTFLSDQQASASGPGLTGLTSLALNLTSPAAPVKLIVHVRYHGADVRTVQLSWDGLVWTASVVSPNSEGIPDTTGGGGSGDLNTGGLTTSGDVTGDTTTGDLTTGDLSLGKITPSGDGSSDPTDPGPSGPASNDPAGPTGLVSVPEPSLTAPAGIALAALLARARRRDR
jgi:hypothetical protein